MVAAVLWSALGCSDPTRPAGDAAVVDESGDAARDGGDEAARAAALDVDMVLVEQAAGSYRMDAVEVSQRRYAAFLGCSSAATCPNELHTPCEFGEFDAEATPELPVMCVSWRSAAVFCDKGGKRLCRLAELQPVCDATFERIASDGHEVDKPDICVQSAWSDGDWGAPSSAAPVGSAADCRGVAPPYDAIFDVVGNAEELVAECDGKLCGMIGGSHINGPHGSPCDLTPISAIDGRGVDSAIDAKVAYTGFRCCQDAAP